MVFWDYKVKQKVWLPISVIRINLWGLWGFIITSVIIIAFFNAQEMATSLTMLAKSNIITEYKDLHVVLSQAREVLFFNSCHDLLVVVFITTGVASMNKNNKIYNQRYVIAIGGVVVAMLLAIIPFYIGQTGTVDFFVKSNGGDLIEQIKYRKELVELHSLHPSAIIFRELFISLTAGGSLVFVLSLPSISVALKQTRQ